MTQSQTISIASNLQAKRDSPKNAKMPQTSTDFLKLAASIINHTYSGDPLKLESFLSEAKLVNDLAEDANKELCVKFIEAKLEGKALECIPEDADPLIDISEALRSDIKPKNSQVIEGKILALRLVRGNFSKFSEEAEKLAEAFRRTLVVERGRHSQIKSQRNDNFQNGGVMP